MVQESQPITPINTGEFAHPGAKSLLSVHGQQEACQEKHSTAAGEQRTDEQQEKEMTKDPTSGEIHGHDEKVGANDKTPQPGQTEQCNANSDKDKSRVTKLIVPPGHDVPIKQTMTNIFEQCKQDKSEQSPATAPCKGSKPLEVKANIWMSQPELKKTKERGQGASEAKAAQSTPGDLPEAPASWGTTPCISPDVQEPPKRRGRKPKDKSPKDEKDETQQEKPTRSRKRAASKAKAKTPKAKQDASSTTEPASSSARSRRMQEYLQEQKKKRLSALTEPDTPCQDNDDGAASKEEDIPEKPKRRRTKKTRVDDDDEQHAKKKRKESEHPTAASKKEKKQPKAKRASKPKKEATKAKDDGKNKRSTETKKKYSRKSAAYHRAYKSTEGTEEEKRAAAKKAHCMQLERGLFSHQKRHTDLISCYQISATLCTLWTLRPTLRPSELLFFWESFKDLMRCLGVKMLGRTETASAHHDLSIARGSALKTSTNGLTSPIHCQFNGVVCAFSFDEPSVG